MTSAAPKVSILIPTYNRAGYLREAIRSAQAQTYRDVEILVLDDASPDETPQVVAEAAGDPRVRSLRHPRNLGIVGNWRAGIGAASGEFFCLLHDDDTFEPAFVEALIAPLLSDPALVLAFCDQWVMDAGGRRSAPDSDAISARFGRDRLPGGRVADFARTALIDFSVPVGATLFRRASVTPDMLDERAQGAIDAWLFYQCVRTGGGAFFLPERLMNYRSHAGGMSVGQALYMGEGHLFRCRAMWDDPAMAPLRPQLRRWLATALNSYGIDLMAQGASGPARAALRESLRLRVSPRAMAALALACCGPVGVRLTAKIRSQP